MRASGGKSTRVPMPVSAVPAGRLQAAFCSLLPRLQALSLPFDLYHALSLHTLPPAPAPLWCACANEAGAFVLSKTPELSTAALQEVKKIAKEQGLDLGGFCRINNKACGVSNTKSPANDLQDVIGVCLLLASVQVPIACRLCGTDFCSCYTHRFSARGSLSVLLSDTQAMPTATSSTCLTDRRSSRLEVQSALVGPARTSLPSASPVGGSICVGSSKSTPERASASTCLLPHAWPGAACTPAGGKRSCGIEPHTALQCRPGWLCFFLDRASRSRLKVFASLSPVFCCCL